MLSNVTAPLSCPQSPCFELKTLVSVNEQQLDASRGRPITSFQPGTMQCLELLAEGLDAVRLKRLGICQGRSLELIGPGDPMILRIGTSQIGLSRRLASLVLVEVVGHDSQAPPAEQ